jgi:CheY-like chemotaxis protein
VGRQILTDRGYEVLLAESGEKALDVYRNSGTAVDLIILDIGMPGMGGQKCLRELREIDPGIKVIISSGYSKDGHLKNILASGAAGYIAKPFNMSDLLKTVREVLDG